jgi:hypothetical protein
MVAHDYNSRTWRLRQEYHEFEINLGYKMGPCIKTNKQRNPQGIPFKPVRTVIIKKTKNNESCQRCEKWKSWTLLECKLVWPLQKTVQKFLKKLKRELLYDPVTAISLLAVAPKAMRSESKRTICTAMFTVALFTVTRYGNSGKGRKGKGRGVEER